MSKAGRLGKTGTAFPWVGMLAQAMLGYDHTMSDFRAALRALRTSPGFTAVAVITIAVGIAATTTLFSVYDRLILNPVTIPRPQSLIALWANNPQLNFNAPALSWSRYEQIRDHATSFSAIGISAFDNFTLTGNGDPEQLNSQRVSASFFPTLGIMPAVGRNFSDDEDRPNGAAVCIISHELWQTRFGGRGNLVGETIMLNGQSWQVVGILPPRLSPPFGQVQVFAPRVFEVGGLTAIQIQAGAGYAQPIARLKPGVSLAQSATELVALSRAYKESFSSKLDATTSTEPHLFIQSLVGNLEPAFYTLIAAVSFVLLIACANVASLFLGRLTARQKEIAVRQSLGATRTQVVRQFLIESLVFSTVAGGLGMLASLWSLAAITSTVASQLPPNTVLTLNWRALAFTVGVTLISALLVGLAPSIQASKARLVDALKDSARGSSSARDGRFRSALIVAEVALSVVLLVGSSLLLLSFIKLQHTPPGFEPAGAASAFVGVPLTRYPTNPQQAAFFTEVLERLRATPGVTETAAALGLPLTGNPRAPYSVGGRTILPLSQRPLAGFNIVSDDFFQLMRIGFAEGRPFDSDDRDGGINACVINQSLARHVFPGESAIGKILLRGGNADIRSVVVGVIHDVKTNGLNAPVPDEIYYSMRQLGRPGMNVVARTTADPATLQALIRSAVAQVDKDQPISFFATLETNVATSLGTQRIVSSLTIVFAGLAFAISVVGLYSVLAYAVAQRTPEIGIRMALGAQSAQVVRMIMQSGLKLIAVGLLLGLVGAAGAARVIQSLLFDVRPLEPLVYAGVSVTFAVVAALACLVPSLRASRIDPNLALRAG